MAWAQPALANPSAQETSYVPYEVTVSGPIEEVAFAFPNGARTVIAGPLQAGEQRTWKVPLPGLWDPETSPSLVLEVTGEGSVDRVRPWPSADPDLGPSSIGSWVLPYVPQAPAVYGLRFVLLALAWAAVLLALRKRGALALGWSGVGLAAWAWLGSPASEPMPTSVRWIDRAADGAVRAIDAARDVLPVDLASLRAVHVDGSAPVQWQGQAVGAGDPRWELRVPGAYLRAQYTVELGARTLEPEFNGLGTLQGLWVGSSEGGWEARGPWPLGEPLPGQPDLGGPSPPSWLLLEAPWESSVWLGRLGEGAFRGGIDVEASEAWIRWAR